MLIVLIIHHREVLHVSIKLLFCAAEPVGIALILQMVKEKLWCKRVNLLVSLLFK